MEAERLPEKKGKKLFIAVNPCRSLESSKEGIPQCASIHEIATKTEFSIGTLYNFSKTRKIYTGCLIIEKAETVSQIVDEVLSKKDDIEIM
jgi:hypothetical protein